MNYKKQKFKKLRLRDWAFDDQPICKIQKMGVKALTDAELISILLGGSSNDSSLETARLIMSDAKNSLCDVSRLSMSNLMKYEGIGKMKAAIIVAAFELGKREHASEAIVRNKICNSKDIYAYMSIKFDGLSHEECWLILLNNQNNILDTALISHGGVAQTIVDPKIIMKYTFDKLATSIILCHNHPSGKPYPSSCDDRITRKLKSACELLDVQFIDHIIFGDKTYYSYADQSML